MTIRNLFHLKLLGATCIAAYIGFLGYTSYSEVAKNATDYCQEAIADSFCHIIQRKYRKLDNRNSREFEFQEGGGLSLLTGFEELWELAEANDTLVKSANSNKFEIHKTDTVVLASIYCP